MERTGEGHVGGRQRPKGKKAGSSLAEAVECGVHGSWVLLDGMEVEVERLDLERARAGLCVRRVT